MSVARLTAWVLLAAALAACATPAAIRSNFYNPAASVLFFADPQIHNVYGGDVRQTMGEADFFVGVARRHPETNLLARHGMQDLISRGLAGAHPAAPPLLVVLGDATNAGCTGEFESFRKAIDAVKGDRIMLFAHGNHDSFLMGTVNYYQSTTKDMDISEFRGKRFPVDSTWWGKIVTPTPETQNGWKPLCHDSVAKSTPMHKVQWMAKYLDTLIAAPAKLELKEEQQPGPGRLGFSGSGKPGSRLAAMNFDLRGEWTPPDHEDDGLLKTYDSFFVQAVDIGATHRLILIDTSACATIPRSWLFPKIRFFSQNAGLAGCIGDAQLRVIESMATDKHSQGKHIVFAGHFPLNDIVAPHKKALTDLMAKLRKDWTYLSAHTHDAITVKQVGTSGTEINIGSTTDWPMAAHMVSFGDTIIPNPVPGPQPMQEYLAPAAFPTGPELCRHFDAAKALADMDSNPNAVNYKSPGNGDSYDVCIRGVATNWDDYEKKLHKAEEDIQKRMFDDPMYKSRVLSIMAASSLHESNKFSVAKKIAKTLGLFIP